MEFIILSLFCIILIFSIVLDIAIPYALLAGLVIFCIYGRLRHFTWSQLAGMIFVGIKTIKNMVIVFMLIGMLTALWRACGTIPVIISYIVPLLSPNILILMIFLLNCGISMLTGTSFGAAATMGVICMTMAVSMGISPVIAGGAILSGAYFGDRCSPVSTSALLVSELTATNIFDNVRKMLSSALVPFLLSCMIYALIGWQVGTSGYVADLQQLFRREFELHWLALLPAIIIFVLSIFRINVKITMAASIVSAMLLCFFLQHLTFSEILGIAVMGYHTSDRGIGALLNGGGVQSMLSVVIIVFIVSSYTGIFQQTGILSPVKRPLISLSERITPFGGILITSIVTAVITCSQTLTIILTNQLCDEVEPDSQKRAIDLENTAVVISPLVPWSIAGAVPLATIGAPTASLLAACFLYLLPIYSFLRSLYCKKA